MKVLLFEIGGPRKEYNEPLGIELISTYLKSKFASDKISIQVDVKWFFETGHLPDENDLGEYDIIGISLQIGSYERFCKVYEAYCSLSRPPALVVGNVIPTFADKEILSRFNKVICLKGEGEVSFYKLCKELVVKGHLSDDALLSIPNISYLGKKEEVLSTQCIPINVEELPHSERHFLEFLENNGGIARIEGSRGCHWGKCKFCCVKEKYGSNKWRPFALEHILAELEMLGKKNILSPYFTDEDFFGEDYERGKQLALLILEAKDSGRIPSNMNFFLSVMANDVRNPKGLDALTILKDAGLREVFIGIEAFSSQQLKRFGKKANIDTNKVALSKIHAMGIQIDIGYILFDPFMEFCELEENIKYLEELSLNTFDSRSLKKLRIQPKTPIEHTYSSVITGSLDFDNLNYPYNFKDNRVQLVVEFYEQWEEPYKHQIYLLQAESRGEVKSEEIRIKHKKLLGRIRDIDFNALKVIVLEISKNKEARTIKHKLKELNLSRKAAIASIGYVN